MTNFGLPGHEGTDFAAVVGAPVYAAADGVVKSVVKDDGRHPYGNYIRLTHPCGADMYETIYAHLSAFADGLALGSEVRAGRLIGRVGSTGNSTGPHLHLSLKRNGELVNPEPYLGLE